MLCGIGHEVGREITAVELHAFFLLDGGFEAFAFFDGDHAVFADLLHRVGEFIADFRVAVGRDRADLGDGFFIAAFDGHFLEFFGDVFDGLVHAALHLDGADPGDDGFEAFVVNGFGHDGRGGRAVAGHVGGFAGDFADHAGAHVFELVGEFDFAGHGHAVFGDGRRAEALFENHVPPPRAERDADGAGELAHAPPHRFLGFLIEGNHFCHVG